MDDFEQDWADMMAGRQTVDEVAEEVRPYVQQSPEPYDPAADNWAAWDQAANTHMQQRAQPSADDVAFEQDWTDVTGGRQTFDEVWADMMAGRQTFDDLVASNPYGAKITPGVDSTGSSISSGITALLKKLNANISAADIKKWAPLLAGLVSATGVGRAKVTPAGYTGLGSGQSLIPKYTATRTPLAMPAPRAYGAAAQGQQYFSPTQFAAQGGILSLAEGGLAEKGFVIPADVVSHLGNGSSEAGLRVLAQQLGATPIKGEGDGMSDSIATNIDGKRPAKVANDEAYMSPEKVAAIGGGDTGKGAQKLYAMMDKIREARTGNKEQGKQIDAAKFLPGGEVKGYTTGGTTAPTGTTGISENLAGWAGEYVTDMLGQGQALANQPYQGYTGTLTAGTSPISQQAYGQAANFQVPGSVAQASNTMGQLAGTSTTPYNATTFGNTFQAPTPYQGTNFTNQFASPLSAADTAGTQFDTGTFGASEAQQYMNPYLQQSLDPQLAEARRQSQITQLGNAAKTTQAGAFGGSRQALMDTETQRNLGTNLANITGQGYNTAYTNAMAQFNADQARQMQGQQATEQSKQFGTGQKMSAAQLQAQFGLSAQQAQEASRQFGAQQGMTSAQSAAQYGLAGQQAQESSKQFGANLGLQGLQQQLAAAQSQGSLGISSGQLGLQGISQLGQFGQQQQTTEQAALDAQKAQFEAERDNPFKMVQFQQSLLQGLPLKAQDFSTAQTSALQEAIQGAGGVMPLLKALGYDTE